MKYLKLVVFSLLVITSSCSRRTTKSQVISNDESDTSEFIVMSYNIHHANPPSKLNIIDLKAIANVINQQKADVVALQEVDVNTTRSGVRLNEAAELARLTGMKVWFAKSIDYDGGEYGIAILSKFPMENMKNTPLPTDEATHGEHRTLASAELTLPGNKKIIFACTHLDAQSHDTNRQLQIKKILEVLKHETLPVMIAGDFNAVPGSDVISQLDSYFTRSCTMGCPFTIPEINPTKTIDYIAYVPAPKFTVISHQVVDEKYASDHRPVRAVFKLK